MTHIAAKTQNKLRPRALLSMLLLTSLVGCASVPNVSQTYYFPIAQQDVGIVQTVGCIITPAKAPLKIALPDAHDGKKKSKVPASPKTYTSIGPYSTATATVTTTYIADYTDPHTWHYTSVDNSFGDADIAIGVTDDGRLSSISATGGGEGAAIIKSAATVAGVATGFGTLVYGTPPPPVSPPCKIIEQYGTTSGNANAQGGKVYTLTLNYKVRVQTKFAQSDWAAYGQTAPKGTTLPDEIVVFSPNGSTSESRWQTPIPIPLNSGANPVPDTRLAGIAGKFTLTITRVSEPGSPDTDPSIQPVWKLDNDTPSVAVPVVAELNVSVTGPTADLRNRTEFFNDNVLAPSSTPTYVPVPAAPSFGKLATTAQFGASGVVDKLEYNKATALSDLISSGAQIYNQFQPQTTAQKASAVQAQADLIYQQQRLVACELSAANCTS